MHTHLHRSYLVALVATLALLAPAAAGAEHRHSPVTIALERVVAAGAPGAVALADREASRAGIANLRSRRPLHAGDRIRVGSVTKTFTAVVALQLVGEGRLALGDTVEQRLPGLLPYGEHVTLRQLLNHTSGVPDDVATPLMSVFFGDPLRIWTPAQVVDLVRDRPQRFPAGTGWAYSNIDYVLVGLMIEQATGRSLEHELEDRIVRPLRLHDTSFPVREPDVGGAVRGYSLHLDQSGRPVPGALRDITTYSPSFGWGAGNAVSSVREVARFHRALLRGRLLKPELLREALRTVPTGRPGRAYGLGLNVRDSPFGPLVGHDGDIPGFSIQAVSSPDGRHQAVVAINAKFAPDAAEDAFDDAVDAAVASAFTSRDRRARRP